MMSNREKEEFYRTRERLKKAGGFYLSKWNFIKRIEFVGIRAAAPYLIFGSGPFIHLFFEKQGPANNNTKSLLEFSSRLCVFEETGTPVEGIEDLHNAYCLVWGRQYFALVQTEKLQLGGVLCRQDVLSAGKQIVTAKIFENPHPKKIPFGPNQGPTVFELYFTDGTVQEVMCRRKEICIGEPWEISWVQSMTMHNTYRLPLKPGERVTAGFTRSRGTFLGTSQGRLISMRDTQIQFFVEPVPNIAIKQIRVPRSKENADIPILLLLENGSIIALKKKNNFIESKGRYACISEFVFDLNTSNAGKEKYILAGDKDGSVTSIRVDGGRLEILRTFRNRTRSAISAMELYNQSYAVLATESGELQLFDMRQLYCGSIENTDMPPDCVVDSDSYYKTPDGWYFLKDDKFCKAFKGDSVIETYFHRKNMKMKYQYGFLDKEFAISYTAKELAICIETNAEEEPETYEHTFKIPVGNPSQRLTQVILMEPYILLQYYTGHAQLHFIDTLDDDLEPINTRFKTDSRITTAVCIEQPDKYKFDLCPVDLMVAYLDGSTEVFSIDWDREGTLIEPPPFAYEADLRSSYFVSSITDALGEQECLLLSRKGVVYRASKGNWNGQKKKTYATTLQMDLSGTIGNGHSLHETSAGVLAAGFKPHTLHVCKVSALYQTYCHLLSVDTRSSRLPFTIIDHDRGIANQLIVSYYDKSRKITEQRFTAPMIGKLVHTTKHTGIITTGLRLNYGCDHGAADEFVYSGDTDGNFCIWQFNDNAPTGQVYSNSFKLNGAVTCIKYIDSIDNSQATSVAVCTSQGDLHLYKQAGRRCIQLLPTIPYNVGQKVTYMTSGYEQPDNRPFLHVYLGNGTVKYVKIDTSKPHEYNVEQMVTVKKVAKFPIATKIAISTGRRYITAQGVVGVRHYITALGVDGILRRMLLGKNKTIEMKWKISALKEVDMQTVHNLLVGDPGGWVYLVGTALNMRNWFHIDRLHKHEVIDIEIYTGRDGFVLVSLDITGTVVIRHLLKREFRPIIWASGVPSPRKIIIMNDKREVVILGRGAASKAF